MTTIVRDIFVFVTAAIFVAAAVLITTGAGAHEFKVGALDIGHPWSRPTPKDANIAGGYLTITNKGKTADRLIGGASPAAGQIEVHEVVDVDGMTKTRPLANGIEIKPGKTVELKPGALRIVLLGLKEPFQLGQKIKGTLVFEKAGPVEIVYNVEENPGAAVSGVAGAMRSTSTIRVRLRGSAWEGSPPLQISERRRAVRRHAPDQQRRAVAIGDGWSRTHHSPARILTSVQSEPNLSRHRSQPAIITAKKASGLAVRGHAGVRIASRDRTGILCPHDCCPAWGLDGGGAFFLAIVVCSSGNSSGLAAGNAHGRVKRSSFPYSEGPRRAAPS